MNPARQKKLVFFSFMVVVIALVTFLILFALRQNISLFYTPTQAVSGEVPANQTVRLGGMVVNGSIIRSKQDLTVQFKLTDFKNTVVVNYQGILPDLFREGQGIVAMGTLSANHEFKAVEVLAKHDANYMPPEVKAALSPEKNVSRKESL